MMEVTQPLKGRRIVVPESRELDLFAGMLEAQGAETIRCPMVRILDAEDPAPIEAWLRRLATDRFDDLILLTGEGLRRLLALARRLGIEAEIIVAVKRLRTVTRGPKPARVLRELGLTPGIAPSEPTTAGIIAALSREKLAGRRVGVQLYPDNPNERLLGFLSSAGAAPDPVLPYRYASDSDTARVQEIIQTMAKGKVDAVAFTSSPQVARFREVARARNLEDELRQGLTRTRIAAVGPVVAAAVEALGAKVAIMPQGSFHMKPLITAIRTALSEKNANRG